MQNARLLKRNADIESEISTKIDEGEKQALEIFRRVKAEADEMHQQAERELKAATEEAGSLIENAEETLENARSEADRLAAESESMALNVIADARARAEKLSMRSLEITRESLMDAEQRLARLPGLQASIEQFISETNSLLTPEQEVIIARRKSLDEKFSKPLEAEVSEPEEAIDDAQEVVAEAETDEKN